MPIGGFESLPKADHFLMKRVAGGWLVADAGGALPEAAVRTTERLNIAAKEFVDR